MDDRQCIESILNGNKQAFSLLVSRYERMAYNIAFWVMESREEAEEVVQDAFVKAYRALPDFQFGSKFSTWFYKIVYRTALSAYKSQTLSGSLEEVGDSSISGDELDYASSLLERKDRKDIIKGVLQSLSKDDALMLTLFYMEECSIEEIRQITNLSVSNIKVKLFRARKHFYEKLQLKVKNEMYDLL